MNRTLFTIFSILFSVTLYAQSTGWAWARRSTPANNMEGYLVTVDKHANAYVGMYNYNGGIPLLNFGSVTVTNPYLYHEAMIAKYDSAGVAQWAMPLTGTTAITGMVADDSDNLLIFGPIGSSIQIDTITLYSSVGEYYIAEISSSGSVVWAMKDGGNTVSGFFAAWYYGLSGGIKTDAAGNVYVATYFNGASINVGAYTLTNADTAGAHYDGLVAKYARRPGGLSLQWAKSFGGPKDEFLRSLTVTPDGHSYVTGTFWSSSFTFGSATITGRPTGGSMYLAEYDTYGNPVWAGGSTTHYAYPTSLASDKLGNIFVAGGFSDTLPLGTGIIYNPSNGSNAFVAKLDTAKNILWYKVPVFPAGSTTGYPRLTFNAVATDECNNVWANASMGTPKTIYYFNVDTNRIDSPARAGAFIHLDQDPGCIMGFTSSGAFISGQSLQSGFDDMTQMACIPGGGIYLSADYMNGYLMTQSDTLLDTSDKESYLLVRYNYSLSCDGDVGTLAASHITGANSMLLFPNPASDECTIHTDKALGAGARVLLYDMYGRQQRACALSGNDNVISLRGLAAGIYQCTLIAGGSPPMTAKLVVTK